MSDSFEITIVPRLGSIAIENTPLAINLGGTGADNIGGVKVNLGLENVDNTSDLAKPISTATQSALDLKINKASGSFINQLTGTRTADDNQPLYLIVNKSRSGGDLLINDYPLIIRANSFLNGANKLSGDIRHQVTNVGVGTEASKFFFQNLIGGVITSTLDISDKLSFRGVDITPEEGTFTPILRTIDDATEPTYTDQFGYYIKYGQKVTIFLSLTASSVIATGSGLLRIAGLPFNTQTLGDNYYLPVFGRFHSFLTYPLGLICGFTRPGASVIDLQNDGAGNSLTYTEIKNGSNILIGLTYFTD